MTAHVKAEEEFAEGHDDIITTGKGEAEAFDYEAFYDHPVSPASTCYLYEFMIRESAGARGGEPPPCPALRDPRTGGRRPPRRQEDQEGQEGEGRKARCRCRKAQSGAPTREAQRARGAHLGARLTREPAAQLVETARGDQLHAPCIVSVAAPHVCMKATHRPFDAPPGPRRSADQLFRIRSGVRDARMGRTHCGTVCGCSKVNAWTRVLHASQPSCECWCMVPV